MEYYIFWAAGDGAEEGMCDEPFESREAAEAEIEKLKGEDWLNGEEWQYRVEEREKEEDEDESESEERELECGDYVDGNGVVTANGIRRFGSAMAREMWAIGMSERDFC